MNKKIDVFAHVLPHNFYREMIKIKPDLPEIYPFITHPLLTSMEKRRQHWNDQTQQIISAVNINPEDYVGPEHADELCRKANTEIIQIIQDNSDMFQAGVAMLPMNNITGAIKILNDQVYTNTELIGIQLFTRALGESIASPNFRPIFKEADRLNLPIFLHPVFDLRKPDNNIIFSWEYELSQAMLQLVQADIFTEMPNLKIIVHHAGAMVPYFSERIKYILSAKQAKDFKKFYVDTAILGNSKALELAISYYGVDHVLFGTDAPLGIGPAGATDVIISAIHNLGLTEREKNLIFSGNSRTLVKKVIEDDNPKPTTNF